MPTKDLFLVLTFVVRAEIALAFVEIPEALFVTEVSKESILEALAEPEPNTSVCNVDIAEALAATPPAPLTVFCKAVIALELDVITESLTDTQLLPSFYTAGYHQSLSISLLLLNYL